MKTRNCEEISSLFHAVKSAIYNILVMLPDNS